MTKVDLIFDWRKSESSFRDKLIAFVLVAVVAAAIFGTVGIRFASPLDKRSESASILRFRDDDLGRSWLLQAEEDGPFPGRLELDRYGSRLATEVLEGEISWSDYQSELRDIGAEEAHSQERVASKGMRMFPPRSRAAAEPEAEPTVLRKLSQTPVLTPYDASALAWMPQDLPNFLMPEGVESVSTRLRFAVNLREDGSVRESISLGGGDDPLQAAIEEWLRGVRFKLGSGDRWLGLRVEFMNQPEDGNKPE
jgi:hypothetical protein